MACATCSSEPVALASSTAVLMAGADSSEPSVASNNFVGYIVKKLPHRCPGIEAISTRKGCGSLGEPHRLFPCSTPMIRCYVALARAYSALSVGVMTSREAPLASPPRSRAPHQGHPRLVRWHEDQS